ncbi:AsmA-like C-terminal region-containing protein [Sabulilitoribacter arenilitoris]|uniref:AsmA-like C-terminal region-containing protein n=1 Tax=Wocania arenilitoris TaxID=2044858 RepID=A0AAE3JQX7_9FLAO|nr:AsmA-like C-terminal region-containing protein [Wocania arenilitoris]MCF7569620.1 AsmA-like C-terminal region-containing protein [Wocania arenilitoris]
MIKALKIIGITLLIIIALLIAIPFAFQGQIKDMVKRFINENVNAKVEFSDVSLSFLNNFPQAHVSVSDLIITNFEPFKDETLATAKNISFTMPIKELFKKAGDDPIIVNSIDIDAILLTLKTNKFGTNNYDIAKEKESEVIANNNQSFSFNLEDYSIKNSALTYLDEASNIAIHVSELNHEGNGIFSAEASELDTKSEANISITIDSTNYLSNNPVKLDALIGLDLNNSIYTFKENKGFINDLPLEFQGYVKQLENEQQIDISFKNPESDFKNFLAVIPKAYSKNIDDLQTTGDFKVNGVIKGLSSEKTIPNLDINITSNNASFKYPNLPKRVTNISINTSIKNTTGNADDTYVDIEKLNFKIDDDVFKSSATLKNIIKNMLVNANIDGVLNLANITKVYPIKLENALSGILKGKINTSFDMKAIESNAYERIKNNGSASISDFVFSSEDIINPIHISQADMTFNPGTVSLNNFKAKTGDSDLNATGTIKNLLGFLLIDNTLQGNFNVNSNLFKVSDFMTEDEASSENKTTSDTESLKIPAFLDCAINANAKTVVYDNLNLKDVKGALLIKDQQATLRNMTSSIFDGALSIAGNISTKNKTPTFNLDLGANGFDIAKSFKDMELLQNLAPIAKLLAGKLNTNINLSGKLDKEFSPDLSSVSGNAFAEFLATRIGANQNELMTKLEGALNFIDFKKLDLKDLKTKLEFANGQVSVKQFQIKYEDIIINVSGSHGFDKTLNYSAIFNVPAKYLGSEINQLIGKINTEEAKNISIPVTANIDGTYTNPNVKTDLTSGISNLTKQLIEIEKQKLLNQSKDKIKDLIGDVIGDNKTKTDSLKKEQNNTVKDVLGGIVNGNKTPLDSTKTNTNDAVKNVLGGLLGKKKKKQDTIN